jgi:hypothetical protein
VFICGGIGQIRRNLVDGPKQHLGEAKLFSSFFFVNMNFVQEQKGLAIVGSLWQIF